MTDLSWSYPIAVAELPPEGADIELVPDERTRAELARHVEVLAVPTLVARLKVTPGGGGALVEGTLEASVRQTCVVTLDPFECRIAEPIRVRFAPTGATQAVAAEMEIGDEDPPDPLVDGTIDLAALVAEFLALAVDPYPRKPGAVFKALVEEARETGDSAFAALAKLKDRKSEKG
jgi:uncharacterized metal-binding protein YceD (DUF177 family)